MDIHIADKHNITLYFSSNNAHVLFLALLGTIQQSVHKISI
jgi:hypothetical protein